MLFLWLSHQKNSVAGKWLESKCNNQQQTLTNEQFRISLRRRLGIKVEGYMVGQQCSCKRAVLDPLGHHMAGGCGQGMYRIQTHDEQCGMLAQCARHAGFKIRREEKGLFIGEDVDNRERPDITICNPPNIHDNKILLDVTVVNTILYEKNGQKPSTRYREDQVVEVGAKTKLAETRKNYKYKAGYQFIPIVFESSGFVSLKTLELLKMIAKQGENHTNIAQDILYNYYLKLVSIRLQKSLANAIIGKRRMCCAGVVNAQSVTHHDVYASREGDRVYT